MARFLSLPGARICAVRACGPTAAASGPPGQRWTASRSWRILIAHANPGCAHRTCWIEEAHVTELTSLLREGPHGDQLAGWPAAMRVFARRERPHPGAQLTLFELSSQGASLEEAYMALTEDSVEFHAHDNEAAA